MVIDYGPPGVAGVKSLQYLSDFDGLGSTRSEACALPIAKVAGAVWLGSKVVGNRSLARYSFWTAVGALVWHWAGKPKAPQATTPKSTAGG